MDYEQAIKNIRLELKNYINDNKLKSLVLGISGGIDSTLCALLAKPVCDELKISLIGLSLPSETNSSEENSRAKEIGESFCTKFKEVNIENGYFHLMNLAGSEFSNDIFTGSEISLEKTKILNGNIKARIRMILLYDLAGATNGMVLSTDNYTEYLLGFWTLHGDVGDYGMIQSLWKTEVYEMSEWIQNNEYSPVSERGLSIKEVIEADATDGLGISETDLDQILPEWKGNSRDGYTEVDKRLQGSFFPGAESSTNPVLKRRFSTEFKRNNPCNIPRYLIIKKNKK